MVPTIVHTGDNVFPPKASLVTVRDMYRDHRSILVYPYLHVYVPDRRWRATRCGRRRGSRRRPTAVHRSRAGRPCTAPASPPHRGAPSGACSSSAKFFFACDADAVDGRTVWSADSRETVISEFQSIYVSLLQAWKNFCLDSRETVISEFQLIYIFLPQARKKFACDAGARS